MSSWADTFLPYSCVAAHAAMHSTNTAKWEVQIFRREKNVNSALSLLSAGFVGHISTLLPSRHDTDAMGSISD
jgi:hypothetical protein